MTYICARSIIIITLLQQGMRGDIVTAHAQSGHPPCFFNSVRVEDPALLKDYSTIQTLDRLGHRTQVGPPTPKKTTAFAALMVGE